MVMNKMAELACPLPKPPVTANTLWTSVRPRKNSSARRT